LAASFKPRSTVELLERNYQTYCSQNELMVEHTDVSMRDKIAQVLEKTGLGEARSAKCSEGDFLKLLQAFREENIFFC
jgi:18S rRNA (adenine1779-N6/adenine1780-N6)-dimethyltransferase